MVKIHDVNQDSLVQEVASQLQKDGKVTVPDWANFVKTGNNKERPPIQENWWYLRSASILKKIYTHGPIGVAKLRTKYGSKKNMGVRPAKFVKSGGKVIRVILQQLESAGYVKKEEKAQHRGRVISGTGTSLMDKAAGAIYKKVEPKPAPKPESKPEPKPEAEPKPEPKPAENKEEPKAEPKPAPEQKEQSQE